MGELRALGGLTNVRFAANPLSELALSTMIIRYPGRHPFHASWFQETAEARARIGEERILSLINERKDIPDLFLRPAQHKATTFHHELERIAKLPAARWRRDFDYVWPDGPPPELGRTDTALRETALEILTDYWNACMARYWPGFKTILDADVTYRAHQLASSGPMAALTEIGAGWIADGEDLVLPLRSPGYHNTFDARITPVTMLPTLVKWNHNLPNREEADLVVSYRARGRGKLAERQAETMPALVGVFGRVRTELLLSLEEPASSTAISLFLGVTPSAVNQHLRALAAAGLLQKQRYGRYVLYARSPVAQELIDAVSG